MTTKVFISIIMLFGILSCEKLDFRQNLTGKWEIFGSGGGIAGQGTTCNFDFMYLERGNDYRFSRNDTIIENGGWELINNDNQAFPADYKIRFFQEGRIGTGAQQISNSPMLIQMNSNDTIILSDGMIDGFQYYFKRH